MKFLILINFRANNSNDEERRKKAENILKKIIESCKDMDDNEEI